MGKPTGNRPNIIERVKLLIWARAAGRCTLCNADVTGNEVLGEPVPIGELAHNVGWGPGSPRGESATPADGREGASNLLLLCRNCHKPIDDGGVVGRYSVDELLLRKREHEARIRGLTAIGAERSAYVLRVIGDIRGVPPELSRETVMAAATRAGLYPRILPGGHWDADADLDLRGLGEMTSADQYSAAAPRINDFARRIHDGVRREHVNRIALFGFARIPLLIMLGAALDDKLPCEVFQRHRRDSTNAWSWGESSPIRLEIRRDLIQRGRDGGPVAVMLNLSGSIPFQDVQEFIPVDASVYVLSPASPVLPGPSLVRSSQDLQAVEASLRELLAAIEVTHGRLGEISVFPAVGTATAVLLGRALMPQVSPKLRVFDRGPDGEFFLAATVHR